MGMGYVGAVSAACFADQGHHVVGVDTNERKVGRLLAGDPGFHEPGLAPMLETAVREGRFTATQSLQSAVEDVDLIQVSVGTPTGSDGAPELGAVVGVARSLSDYLGDRPCTVMLRSTVPPGTTRSFASLVGGDRRTVVFCPEFLREGQAVQDFFQPPYTVLGSLGETGEAPEFALEAFSKVEAPVHCVPVEAAELLKLASNGWHANKVAFANEIGRLAAASDVDGGLVMDLLASDTKLNVSARYLSPGFVFGGSCLPKDVRALQWLGARARVGTPVLDGVLESNRTHLSAAVDSILARSPATVGIYGLAFKPGTDDVRESGAMMLAAQLIQAGVEVVIADEVIKPGDLSGRNLGYALEWIPDLSERLADTTVDLRDCDVIVATHPLSEEARAALNGREIVHLSHEQS